MLSAAGDVITIAGVRFLKATFDYLRSAAARTLLGTVRERGERGTITLSSAQTLPGIGPSPPPRNTTTSTYHVYGTCADGLCGLKVRAEPRRVEEPSNQVGVSSTKMQWSSCAKLWASASGRAPRAEAAAPSGINSQTEIGSPICTSIPRRRCPHCRHPAMLTDDCPTVRQVVGEPRRVGGRCQRQSRLHVTAEARSFSARKRATRSCTRWRARTQWPRASFQSGDATRSRDPSLGRA